MGSLSARVVALCGQLYDALLDARPGRAVRAQITIRHIRPICTTDSCSAGAAAAIRADAHPERATRNEQQLHELREVDPGHCADGSMPACDVLYRDVFLSGRTARGAMRLVRQSIRRYA